MVTFNKAIGFFPSFLPNVSVVEYVSLGTKCREKGPTAKKKKKNICNYDINIFATVPFT